MKLGEPGSPVGSTLPSTTTEPSRILLNDSVLAPFLPNPNMIEPINLKRFNLKNPIVQPNLQPKTNLYFLTHFQPENSKLLAQVVHLNVYPLHKAHSDEHGRQVKPAPTIEVAVDVNPAAQLVHTVYDTQVLHEDGQTVHAKFAESKK